MAAPTKDTMIGQFYNPTNSDYIQSVSEGGFITTILAATGAVERGIAVTASNFTPTGWGTGAVVSGVSGTTTVCEFTITAGTSPSSSPTILFTVPVNTWVQAPICLIQMTGGNGQISDFSYTKTSTSITLTYLGLPVASQTYQITIFSIGTP